MPLPTSESASAPRVAICIPTYNQASYLQTAVASAVEQSYTGAIEIWVGDDASTDATPTVLASLSEQHAGLRVVRRPENLGIAGNCSELMAASGAPFIVRLDSDDELRSGFVARAIEQMLRYPRAGYVHSAVEEINEAGSAIRSRRLLRLTGYQDSDEALRAALSGYRTVANILMFRSEAIRGANLYRGRPEFVEDYDLSVRLADHGWGNVYVDEPLARYRVWTDSRGTRAKRKALQLDGYRRIFDDSFRPAWSRRNWPTTELTNRRTTLALQNCAACFEPQYNREERDELVNLLRRLGDSRRLAVRIWLCSRGLAPWISRGARWKYRVKTLSKPAIKRLTALRRRQDEGHESAGTGNRRAGVTTQHAEN